MPLEPWKQGEPRWGVGPGEITGRHSPPAYADGPTFFPQGTVRAVRGRASHRPVTSNSLSQPGPTARTSPAVPARREAAGLLRSASRPIYLPGSSSSRRHRPRSVAAMSTHPPAISAIQDSSRGSGTAADHCSTQPRIFQSPYFRASCFAREIHPFSSYRSHIVSVALTIPSAVKHTLPPLLELDLSTGSALRVPLATGS